MLLKHFKGIKMNLLFFLSFLLSVIGIQTAPLDNEHCVGLDCRQIMSIPLLDNMKATLKADLDVTEMNKRLQRYIHEEIQSTVLSVLNSSVHDLVTEEVEKITDPLISKLKDSLTGPAFYASLKRHPFILYIKNDVVKFDDVRVNRGGGYDSLTGRFTAPKQGLYYFSCMILGNNNSPVNYALSKNDIMYSKGFSTQGILASSTVSVIVEMLKGDFVSITHRTNGAEEIYGHDHSSFAGYFL